MSISRIALGIKMGHFHDPYTGELRGEAARREAEKAAEARAVARARKVPAYPTTWSDTTPKIIKGGEIGALLRSDAPDELPAGLDLGAIAETPAARAVW